MITVTLENHGQSFLEWDIEAGKVIACRPSNSGGWVGTEVHNLNIRAGDILILSLKGSYRRSTLNYPVKSVSWPKPMSHNITSKHPNDYRSAWGWQELKGN